VSDWRTLLDEFDRVEPSSAIPARALARAAELEPSAARQALPRWLRWTAAGALTTLVIVALAFAAHTRRDATPATPRQVDTGIFSKTHGWITLSGQQIIALNPADPTQTRVLSRAGVFPIAWSRDGSQLLVTGPRGFGVLHANGSWTRLDRERNASGGSFTPDGTHVIYAENGTIWSVPANGGKREAIARGGARGVYDMPGETGNQLSPDGRTLVYTPGWTTPQTMAIALINSDGSNQRPLVSYRRVLTAMGISNWRHSSISDLFALAWLGNSSQVVILAANKNNTRCALFAVNTNGSDLRRWGPRGLCPARAALSPDGSHLAFTANLHHRDGLLITDDTGHITQTILFPHRAAHPVLTWQPPVTVTVPKTRTVTSHYRRYRVLSGSAVPGFPPGATRYVGTGTQDVTLVMRRSGLLHWTDTFPSFEILASPRSVLVDSRGRGGYARIPKGHYSIRVIAPGGHWTLTTP
jgi:Tol biopolymer transport system component